MYSRCSLQESSNCSQCAHDPVDERCFVQQHETANENLLKIKTIDPKLHYVGLRWQCRAGDQVLFEARRGLGMVPIKSLHGLVHVVSKYLQLWLLD